MRYSITPILHNYADKDNRRSVMIQVIFNRQNVRISTPVKVDLKDFVDGTVVNHPSKATCNSIIRGKIIEVETKLLNALQKSEQINLKDLFKSKNNSAYLVDFISRLADNEVIRKKKKDDGVIRHIRSLGNKISEYYPNMTFDKVSLKWLQDFELKLYSRSNKYGEPLDANTVHANMKRLKGVLNKAAKLGMVDKSQFEDYNPPKYTQKIPEYLTEAEMSKLYDFLQKIDGGPAKLAGYYFLLGCYAGYRISDLSSFNYAEKVKGNNIILRAKKNNQIVSIAIHTRLKKVLAYIKDKPLGMAEQTMREHVHTIAGLCGFGRKIKVHTARHSFAMLLAANGFSLDEAAELLGDSRDVASVYYRISNQSLNQKIKDKLG